MMMQLQATGPVAAQREVDASVKRVQIIYTGYAVALHRIHMTLSVVILLCSSMMLLFAPGILETSQDDQRGHLPEVIFASIVTLLHSLSMWARFDRTAVECDHIASLLSVYISGFVADEAEMNHIKRELIYRIRATTLLWFETPLLLTDDDDDGQQGGGESLQLRFHLGRASPLPQLWP